MDKKPNQDEIEAMKEMVRTKMGYGASIEAIIRDILGWGDVKGFTKSMILDEISLYKENESKPWVVHSPKDLPEPIKPVVSHIVNIPEQDKELELLKYVKGAVKGGNAPTEDILIKMAKTRRAYFQSNMTDEFLHFMCSTMFKEHLIRQMKELKKRFKKRPL